MANPRRIRSGPRDENGKGRETEDEESVNHLEQLIIDMKESLEREIRQVRESLERELHEGFDRVNTRFDTQAARLERHAGLLQTGSRWTNRMNQWAEKIDRALEVKDREIADLRVRLQRLEQADKHGANGGPPPKE